MVLVRPTFTSPALATPGSYEAELTITPESIPDPPIRVPVSVQVTGPALQVVSPYSFDVDESFNSPTMSQESPVIEVRSAPGSSIPLLLRTEITYDSAPSGWLSLGPGYGDSASFRLRATGSPQFRAGIYTAHVALSAAGYAPTELTVNLQVSQRGAVTADAATLSLALAQAGAAGTRLLRLTAARGGATPYNVDPSPSTPWLTVAKRTGTTPETIVVTMDPGSLPPSTYSGYLSITSPTNPTPLIVRTTMTVGPPDKPLQTVVSYSPSALRFTRVLGGPPPEGQSVQIRLTPTIPSAGVAFLTQDYDGEPRNWLLYSLAGGVLSVSVGPAVIGFPRGTYTARLRVQLSGALTNPDIEIPVTLVIQGPAPPIVIGPSNMLRFNTGGIDAATERTLSLESNERVPFEITTASTLLTLVGAKGTTPGTVIVRAKTAGLLAGTYLEELTLRAPESSSDGQKITALITTGVPAGAEGFAVYPRSLAYSADQGTALSPAQSFTVQSHLWAGGAFGLRASQPWVTFEPATGMTGIPNSVRVNPAGLAVGPHQAVISVTSTMTGALLAELPVTLTVSPSQAPVVSSWTNAASRRTGPLAPGMLFTLTGTNLGPQTGIVAAPAGGRYGTTLSGVRVLLDGLAAPILYASAVQINAAVPYGLTGRASAQLQVEFNGQRSPAASVRLDDAAPGIFTTDGAQAAALNEDGSVNSAANPAQAGQVVVLFVTGEGATWPVGVDGELVPGSNLRRPQGTVRVRVNQVEVPAGDILYAGSAPGLIAGLMQVNLRLPGNLPANPATPVEVLVGASASATGVTVAVR